MNFCIFLFSLLPLALAQTERNLLVVPDLVTDKVGRFGVLGGPNREALFKIRDIEILGSTLSGDIVLTVEFPLDTKDGDGDPYIQIDDDVKDQVRLIAENLEGNIVQNCFVRDLGRNNNQRLTAAACRLVSMTGNVATIQNILINKMSYACEEDDILTVSIRGVEFPEEQVIDSQQITIDVEEVYYFGDVVIIIVYSFLAFIGLMFVVSIILIFKSG